MEAGGTINEFWKPQAKALPKKKRAHGKVDLVRLSMKQKDALTILLTGRGQDNFAGIIKRIVASKKLEFDMICLKQKLGPQGQRWNSTMNYKQSLLEELLYTYKDIEEIKIYEDRVKHTKAFKEFFMKMNSAITMNQLPISRKPVEADVIQVPENQAFLDPVTECAEVQRMINSHNTAVQNNINLAQPHRLQIKKTVFFTGYLLSPDVTATLLSLIPLASSTPESELKVLANNIMICPRPATQTILDKVGGLGAKQIWQISGVGIYNNVVIAAKVNPLPSSQSVYTENVVPFLVLATRKNGKPADAVHIQEWRPVPSDQQTVFETTVGEKVQLRVEKEVTGENEFDSLFAREKGHSNNKRSRYENDDERRKNQEENRGGRYRGGNHSRGGGGPPGGRRDRSFNNRSGRNPGNNRGGGTGAGGGGGGSSGRNKGRGGYKSLDDVTNGPRNGYQNQPNYDDTSNHGTGNSSYDASFPPLGSRPMGGGLDDSLGQMY